MKRTLYRFFALFFAAALGFSCTPSRPDGPQGGEAWLRLSVDDEPLPALIVTRGGDPIVYKISVTDSNGDEVYAFDDHTAIEGPINLLAGRYTVTAFSGDEPDASLDNLYYYASETIDLAAGEQQNLNLTCRLGGVLVSAIFDEALKEKFPGYSVEVTNAEPDDPAAAPLRFDDGNEGAKGYLKSSGLLTYCVTLTNANGSEFKIKTTLRSDVAPNQHYIFKFRYGEGAPEENVDESMKEHEYMVNIGLGLTKAAPAITERGGADLSQLVLVLTGAAPAFVLDVEAPAEINAMTVTHDSDALAALGLPRSFRPILLEGAALQAVRDLGLTWGAIEHETEVGIDFTGLLETLSDPLSGLGDGDYTFNLWVEDHHAQTTTQSVTFAVSQVQPDVATVAIPEAKLLEYVWAKYATVFGCWLGDTQPDGIGFKYRKVGEETWTDAAGTLTLDGAKGFSLRLTGLAPATEYEYMAVSAGTARTGVQRFTTDGAVQLYNLSFDEWHTGSDGKTVYANPSAAEDTWVWDSGNKGANTIGTNNPTTEEKTIIISGSAVRMETKTVFSVLAAGNIYAGKFGAVQGMSGATLEFGRPYTYRPTSMSGYYRYAPKTINKGDAASGEDRCAIYVALMNRPAPFTVNTSTGKFLDTDHDNTDGVIAFGKLPDELCGPTTGTELNDYQKFTINLTYYDENVRPTHVLVVASASYLGDYFTGGEGSTLYIDEFSFGFDPVD